jgi:5'(3')-deoxyribonucleotidase
MKIQIALDLDGVFANFHKAAKTIHGPNWQELTPSEIWKPMVKDIDDFFLKLEVIPGSKELFNYAQSLPTSKFDVFILTALPFPKGKLANVKEQKTEWVHTHLSPNIKVRTIIGGKNKGKFCNHPHDVLIDDYSRNIKAWEDAGGIGILHKDVSSSISDLQNHIDQFM